LVGPAPPAAIDLAFEAAVVAAREVFFLDGVISVWQGFSRKGLRKGEEILSIDSKDLNETTNVVGNFYHRQLDAPD